MTDNNQSQSERRGEGKADHQKTVQGKKQQGPDEKIGRDIGGGNAGSHGQNVDPRRTRDEHTGKKDDRDQRNGGGVETETSGRPGNRDKEDLDDSRGNR